MKFALGGQIMIDIYKHISREINIEHEHMYLKCSQTSYLNCQVLVIRPV